MIPFVYISVIFFICAQCYMNSIIGFEELFTSYSKSSEKHARGCYALTSYYHTPKNWNSPFKVKIGMSMNLYNRMNNYNLYYTEGFFVIGFVFLPLDCDDNEVFALERNIHSMCDDVYANEWFNVKNIKHAHSLLHKGIAGFPKAEVIIDLSKRIRLPTSYIPMALKDLKVIRKIEKEYADEANAREKEKAQRRIVQPVQKNSLGPAFNTRYFNLKRSAS